MTQLIVVNTEKIILFSRIKTGTMKTYLVSRSELQKSITNRGNPQELGWHQNLNNISPIISKAFKYSLLGLTVFTAWSIHPLQFSQLYRKLCLTVLNPTAKTSLSYCSIFKLLYSLLKQ